MRAVVALGVCTVLIGLVASPGRAQMTSPADDPLTAEEQTHYQISCVATSPAPRIFLSLDLTVPLPLGDIAFDLSVSFHPDPIITTPTRQILVGTRVSHHGCLIDDTRFHTPSSDWTCALYRGDRAWPARP